MTNTSLTPPSGSTETTSNGNIPATAFATGSPSALSATGFGQFSTSLRSSKRTRRSSKLASLISSTTRRRSKAASSPTSMSPFSLFNNTKNTAMTEIEMFAGESRVFPAPGVARIAVGNGQIMSAAALDNREVLVFANAIGTSSLFVWNTKGQYQHLKIHVVPGETSRFAREVAAFLSAIPNAKTSIIGDKVVVEGDHLSDLDLAKIEELAKRYPQIVNFTNRLGWEQMVLLDVKVVEFPVNELREMGLKWNAVGGAAVSGIWAPGRRGDDGPYQIGMPTTAPITTPDNKPATLTSRLNVLSGINMGLSAQLNLLEQQGKAATLAEPQLSARNGSKATFLAGGEYPYTVSTVNGPTVIFKPYGVKLEIVPKVDHSGTIRATIDSEVSAIDTSFTTPAGPALTSRKTNTEFNVKQGETIVLSGLLSRDHSNNVDKVPFLGDIPILGALFRSTRYQNKETELVVFVTPSIIDSHTPELINRMDSIRAQLEKNTHGKPAFLPSIAPKVIVTPPIATPTASSPTAPSTPSTAGAIGIESMPPSHEQPIPSTTLSTTLSTTPISVSDPIKVTPTPVATTAITQHVPATALTTQTAQSASSVSKEKTALIKQSTTKNKEKKTRLLSKTKIKAAKPTPTPAVSSSAAPTVSTPVPTQSITTPTPETSKTDNPPPNMPNFLTQQSN